MRATEMLDYLTVKDLTEDRKQMYSHFDCDPVNEKEKKHLRKLRRDYRKSINEV